MSCANGSPYYYGDYWVNAGPTVGPTYTFPGGPTSDINAVSPDPVPDRLNLNVGTNNVVVIG